MSKTLAKCVREYKKPTILTLIFITGGAIIETLIPFITAQLVNTIKAGADLAEIWKIGGVLIAMAFGPLACGGIAGYTCAKASAGFARNLRHDMYYRCRRFLLRISTFSPRPPLSLE